MDLAIAICAFLGGWLIFAGSVYQASLELKDVEVDREGFEAISSSIPQPPKISPWWWLLPPVAYVKNRARNNEYREAVTSQLKPEQLQGWVDFTSKARGWMIVGFGAFLLALRETYELIVLLDWPVWTFYVISFVVLVLCVAFSAYNDHRTNVVLHKEEEVRERRNQANRARPGRAG